MPLDTTRLQAAINSLASTRQRLAKIEQLVDDHQRLSARARHRMRDAEIALSAAKENESRDTVNALLSDSTVATKPVSYFEDEYEKAVSELENARSLVTNLEREKENSERAVVHAANNHATALGEALSQHPAVIRLHERRRELEAELGAVHSAIGAIFKKHGTPIGFAQSFVEWQGAYDAALRDLWAKAIDGFSQNPETELPNIDDE
jgi:predicted  nucleic acid-binding Zn-ribbon protein